MKKTILTCLALLGLLAPLARAENTPDAQLKVANQTYNARTVTISSSTAGTLQRAVTLYYVGTSSEATVTINASSATFYAPGAADTTIGVGGAVNFAVYTTVGAVCDQINASANYVCKMRDARRSDNINRFLATTAAPAVNSLKATQQAAQYGDLGGFDVGLGSGTFMTSLAPDVLSIGINPAPDHRVILKKCDYTAASSGAGLAHLTVSGILRNMDGVSDGNARNDSTIVWDELIASTQSVTSPSNSTTITNLTRVWGASDSEDGLQFSAAQSPGSQTYHPPFAALGRVVIRVASDVTTTAQSAGNYLRCYWVER